MTIFLIAIFENRLDLSKMIVDSAIDKRKLLSQRDIYGNTPIHLAVLANSMEILTYLQSLGMQLDLKNNVNF